MTYDSTFFRLSTYLHLVDPDVLQDLRYALRTFRSQPGVTAVAVLSLALGLAAAAAAVSLLDALGFRPLAVADPGSLVAIRSRHNQGGSGGQMSYLDYLDLRDRARTASGLASYSIRAMGLSGPEAPPEVVLIDIVSANYFTTLGVTPAIGRAFSSDDAAGNAPPTAVLSHRLWQRRFGGDSAVVRKTVTLNGASWNVIGIAPASFAGLDAFLAPDVWVLLDKANGGSITRERRDVRSLSMFGRLTTPVPAIDILRAVFGRRPPAAERAQSEIDVLVAGLREAYPDTNRDEQARVETLDEVRHGNLTAAAAMLWTIVGLVLAVGCANVAGLLLGRAESRRQELAMRVALGASRRRLVRQLLTESLLLSFVAAGASLLLAIGIIQALPTLLPPMSIPLGFVFRLDLRVVAVTIAMAMATVMVFGLWPALSASQRGLFHDVRIDSTTNGSIRRWSARNVLVVGQVAVSLTLLVSGVLLVRSERNTSAIDPGFTVQPLLLVSLAPGAAGYDGARARVFFREIIARLEAAPGIEAVGLARRVPLDPNGGGAAREVVFPDRPPPADGHPIAIKFNAVSPNYFDVMGTRIVRGRAFAATDESTAPKVVAINETMAKRYWPGVEPIGQRLIVNGQGSGEYEVVGVVQDGKINRLLETPQPYMFFALAQAPSGELTLIVKGRTEAGAAAPIVRATLRQLDPQMPTLQMITLAEHMRYALYEPNLSSTIVVSLSGVGLVLSLIGLYGVIAFVVMRRTKEIGVRLALGARPGDVLRGILRYALTLTLAGVAIGIPLALVTAQALATSLYGVRPSDPLTFVGTAAAITIVALAASWWPARRAMNIDPVKALRTE